MACRILPVLLDYLYDRFIAKLLGLINRYKPAVSCIPSNLDRFVFLLAH
jgi:hypothetical protein